MTEARRRALALAAGIGVALGQVPFSLVPLALAALGLAAWLALGAATVRRAAWVGFFAGLGYFGTTLHWIVEPFLIEPEIYGWLAPFGVAASAAGFALFWALGFGLARALADRGWRFALGFGAALAGAEALRALILTGFPWSLLGYVWSEGPGAQIGAVTGPFGLTLTTALMGGALACLGPRAVTVAALAAFWLGPLALGALRPLPPPPAEDAPRLRIVQPNAPQAEKMDPARAGIFFERALDLTAAGAVPDLVVWPETSVPYAIAPGHPALARMATAARGAALVFGAPRVEGARYYNALILLGADGDLRARYDKYHLVPFGEYVPLGDLAARFGISGLAQSRGFGYSPGPGPRLLDFGPLGRVQPLICYEAIFPEEVGSLDERPDWMLHLTNDAWFGTFAGPPQHLAIARMRAIEQGVPLVRAANTGISAVIDATGRVTASLALGRAGSIDAALPRTLAPTPYSRLGDWPVWAALAGCAALAAAGRRKTA